MRALQIVEARVALEEGPSIHSWEDLPDILVSGKFVIRATRVHQFNFTRYSCYDPYESIEFKDDGSIVNHILNRKTTEIKSTTVGTCAFPMSRERFAKTLGAVFHKLSSKIPGHGWKASQITIARVALETDSVIYQDVADLPTEIESADGVFLYQMSYRGTQGGFGSVSWDACKNGIQLSTANDIFVVHKRNDGKAVFKYGQVPREKPGNISFKFPITRTAFLLEFGKAVGRLRGFPSSGWRLV
jgi:hypothetical protein